MKIDAYSHIVIFLYAKDFELRVSRIKYCTNTVISCQLCSLV